jgi:uncharacterized repeat protein (TIGR03803 family)
MKNTAQLCEWILRMRLATAGVILALASVLVPAIITTQSAQAQVFTSLYSFAGTDGASPKAGLVQATNGDLYGTTYLGGADNDGTVFKITPSGTLTTLYGFAGYPTDGGNPDAGVVLATDGHLYGTTYEGEASDAGAVFEITPGGGLKILYSFCSLSDCTDGYFPYAGLIQAANGYFYGTTYEGGTNNQGTIFSIITPSDKLTTLHSFDITTNPTDGIEPYAGLVQATDGNLYGTTYGGGSYLYGTVFKFTPVIDTVTTLHSFDVTDGYFPTAGLVQATDGNLYGTTFAGGANEEGTVFKITPGGMLTTLYSFCSQSGCTDGAYPWAGLVQATDGNLYGTTYGGGTNGQGTVFRITLGGSLTKLYDFCSQSGCTDGDEPVAGLVQATNGTLYGTTEEGGVNGKGTVFNLSIGLGPFVALQSTSGKEGAKIGILGQGFGSSSVVKFGGTQATTIAVTGTTFISATVPAGALTGSVTVTTGATTLTSSHIFGVRPTITTFSPPSGPVGTAVTITGTGLKQATKVGFSGKSASFTATSDTQISTTVPTGATTGKIAVTTPGGSATSTTSFTVN